MLRKSTAPGSGRSSRTGAHRPYATGWEPHCPGFRGVGQLGGGERARRDGPNWSRLTTPGHEGGFTMAVSYWGKHGREGAAAGSGESGARHPPDYARAQWRLGVAVSGPAWGNGFRGRLRGEHGSWNGRPVATKWCSCVPSEGRGGSRSFRIGFRDDDAARVGARSAWRRSRWPLIVATLVHNYGASRRRHGRIIMGGRGLSRGRRGIYVRTVGRGVVHGHRNRPGRRMASARRRNTPGYRSQGPWDGPVEPQHEHVVAATKRENARRRIAAEMTVCGQPGHRAAARHAEMVPGERTHRPRPSGHRCRPEGRKQRGPRRVEPLKGLRVARRRPRDRTSTHRNAGGAR